MQSGCAWKTIFHEIYDLNNIEFIILSHTEKVALLNKIPQNK